MMKDLVPYKRVETAVVRQTARLVSEIGKGMPIGAINCYFVVPGHSEIAATGDH